MNQERTSLIQWFNEMNWAHGLFNYLFDLNLIWMLLKDFYLEKKFRSIYEQISINKHVELNRSFCAIVHLFERASLNVKWFRKSR